MATWLVGGVKLAKAKGYDGGVAMGVLLVGYLVPVISILMPLIILFGFEDKTKNRRSRF
jgi:hypothetical protein